MCSWCVWVMCVVSWCFVCWEWGVWCEKCLVLCCVCDRTGVWGVLSGWCESLCCVVQGRTDGWFPVVSGGVCGVWLIVDVLGACAVFCLGGGLEEICICLVESCAFMLTVGLFGLWFGVVLCVCCLDLYFWCVICGCVGCDFWFSGSSCVCIVYM